MTPFEPMIMGNQSKLVKFSLIGVCEDENL
jgi:hypothetical protein